MNLKTFCILFLLGLLVSCASTNQNKVEEDNLLTPRNFPQGGFFR